MFNLHFRRQLVAFPAVGAVALAALACVIALVCDTMGHDWYAAGKPSSTEILIRTGFDERSLTQYRTSYGETLTLTRHDLLPNANALRARNWTFYTASPATEFGAWCGIVGVLLLLTLIRWSESHYPVRRTGFDPPPAQRPGFLAPPPAGEEPEHTAEKPTVGPHSLALRLPEEKHASAEPSNKPRIKQSARVRGRRF